MQTILFNLILFLVLVWLMIGIFFFVRFFLIERHMKNAKVKSKEDDSKEVDKDESVPYSLVGKSKAFVAEKTDNKKENNTNRHSAVSESTGQTVQIPQDKGQGHEPSTYTEEENEMHVNYSTDEEDEIIKEELPLVVEEIDEVSPNAILSRELQRMRVWKHRDDDLEEIPTETKENIRRLRGTDILDKYRKHLMQQESDNQKLLAFIRKAEEEDDELYGEYAEEDSTSEQPADNAVDSKPLSYYL